MQSPDVELNVLLCQQMIGILAVPDVAVAEILDKPLLLKEAVESAHWYLGETLWRERKIPVLALDQRQEAVADMPLQYKVLVMHAVSDAAETPFYGLVVSGAPRMERIKSLAVTDSMESENTDVAMTAKIHGESVFIPDLAALEGLAASHSVG